MNMKNIFKFLLCAAVLNLSGVGSKLVAFCDDGFCAEEEEESWAKIKARIAQEEAEVNSFIKWYALGLNQKCESGLDSECCNEYEICKYYPRALAPEVLVVQPNNLQLVALKQMFEMEKERRE